MLYCSGDGLFVVNLRSALIDLDTELTTETIHDDVKVKLTHSADDCLAGLVIRPYGERRILLSELAEGDAKLVQVALGLRLDSDTDNRIREFHRFEHNLMILVADGVSCTEILESDSGADVSGLDELDRVLMVGVHLVQTRDSFLLSGADVIDISTGVNAS